MQIADSIFPKKACKTSPFKKCLAKTTFHFTSNRERYNEKSCYDLGLAIAGHVYLEHVRDELSNDFFVLFQVIDVDPQSRYVAFIWRKLPGGKRVKEQ